MLDRQAAIRLAQRYAKAYPQSYYKEPFEPHEWVINAIVESSNLPRHYQGAKEAAGEIERLKTALGDTRALRSAYGGMIQLAAELTRGSCIPDWSDEACFCKTTPGRDRARVRQALRQIDDRLKDYAVQLRKLADRVSEALPDA